MNRYPQLSNFRGLAICRESMNWQPPVVLSNKIDLSSCINDFKMLMCR